MIIILVRHNLGYCCYWWQWRKKNVEINYNEQIKYSPQTCNRFDNCILKRILLTNLDHQLLIDRLKWLSDVLVAKHEYSFCVNYSSHMHSSQLSLLLCEKNLTTYKSHDSPGPWGCTFRLKPGPATHDVANDRTSDWRMALTGVEGWARRWPTAEQLCAMWKPVRHALK